MTITTLEQQRETDAIICAAAEADFRRIIFRAGEIAQQFGVNEKRKVDQNGI